MTVHVPDINTVVGALGSSLAPSDSDDLITLSLDLSGIALPPLGLPGGGVNVNAGIFNIQ